MLPLIPAPKSLTPARGHFPLPPELWVILPSPRPPADALPPLLFAAEHFVSEALLLCNTHFHVAAGNSVDPSREIRLILDPEAHSFAPTAVQNQAYRLSITRGGISVTATGTAGLFYGLQTLLQLLRQAAFAQTTKHAKSTQKSRIKSRKLKIGDSLALPALTIEDFPDFPHRGVYHDTARGKVPTVETLLQLIDDLGHLKINEFQLYIENNFEFRRHPDIYDDTTPLTSEDLLILDAACRVRHIDFVPSLTSLGHFEKILCRPRYRPLAEAEPEQLKAIGATCWHEAAPWSLCCTDPAAKQLLKEMYDEFAPNFSSRQFNICCDESYDIGVIRSREYAEKLGGPGHLYVEWIRYCEDLARQHGKSIQMWGDIILKYPDLIGQLPEDAVLLEWGYEHDHKFEEHCATFAQRIRGERKGGKQTFYVCPGTSSWITLTARVKNAFGSIHAAAAAGLKHGATGLLVTDWGDYGHQQVLSVSLLPFAYGAAAGWNLAQTLDPYAAGSDRKARRASAAADAAAPRLESLLRATSLHLFQDAGGRFASLAYELGLTYERIGWQRFNASVDWYLFREKWDFANYVNRVKPKDLLRVMEAAERLTSQFTGARLLHPEEEQIRAELAFTCDLVIHTCKRTLLRQSWLAADPARRNPAEETLRTKKPNPLPKGFSQEMKALAAEAKNLGARFEALWLARNKKSRLEDILQEFTRLTREYKEFST